MNTEIELKYLLSPADAENPHIADKITAMFKEQKIDFHYSEKSLINDYFDSENLALRKMDIGLRIRTQADQYEQTVKTAGKVVDGLHQRPEYNVDIDSNQLALSLFPEDIWPENTDIALLQEKMQVIFSTNFTRQAWVVSQGSSVIELALDRGTINTHVSREFLTINELEIELVEGEQQALFKLAELLKTIVSIEPGNLSKAARGYALYNSQ
ncbi:MAG: CYTH domain-containing protein [Colwellia sp.]|nr:CYTH domain-containing protein [Colwellia sp.]MCW8865253.1 CYTH domain-containing protein [Colwellia sp.]MCW9082099.1 CYTH domain-containing protein [Colwellia sp.]